MKLVRVAVELGINRLFTYSVPDELAGVVFPGSRVKVPFGGRLIAGYVIDMQGKFLPEGVKPVHSAVEDFPVLSPEMNALALQLSGYYIVSPGEIIKSMLPGAAKLKREEPVEENSPSASFEPRHGAAVDCLSRKGGGVFVLDGAGPEEEAALYASLAAGCVSSGRQAAVLFPDMASLIRHEKVLSGKLPGLFGVYHGSLSAKKKRSAWEGARSGRLKVVLGLRSAVFSPFRRLGLIIVHEEADFSYKSRRQPRLHAREAALMRGRIEKCAVVLGGNFPSFETFRSLQTAEFSLLRPGRSRQELPAPAVRIVDMRFERAKMFSRSLKQAVFSALDGGGQVLLFLNRRGFSNYFVCRECGFLKRCKNCSVCLRHHADTGKLICHYCNYSEDIKELCPACGKSYFKKSGFGTQQAEAMAGKIFKGARVARLDSDVSKVKPGQISVLEKFARGGLDILVDTGMAVNSGVFENVSVCGIMSADNFLNMPDFRAAENLFRFVSKARSCVGSKASLVVQTYNPGHYAMDCIKTFDRSGFYARESVIRKKLGYPPFGRICNIIISGGNERIVEASAAHFAALLAEELSGAAEVLGPVPAVVSRARNMHRRQVVLKSPEWREASRRLAAFLSRVRNERTLGPGVRITADVDPVNMF